jgi:hypothetical protein
MKTSLKQTLADRLGKQASAPEIRKLSGVQARSWCQFTYHRSIR